MIVERARSLAIARGRSLWHWGTREEGPSCLDGGDLRLETLPGSWNPRRAVPEEYRPAAAAAARVLEEAGWWSPRGPAPPDLFLAAGLEGASEPAAARLSDDLASGRCAPSPWDFLLALPSTLAGVLGLLFRLEGEQATLAGAGASDAAMEWAGERLELGWDDRALVVTLRRGVAGPALLEAAAGRGGSGLEGIAGLEVLSAEAAALERSS